MEAMLAGFKEFAPYLTHPLVLVGFVLLLFFGIHRALIKSGIIPPLSRRGGSKAVQLLLRYGFLLAITVILLGFGVRFFETQRQIVPAFDSAVGDKETNSTIGGNMTGAVVGGEGNTVMFYSITSPVIPQPDALDEAPPDGLPVKLEPRFVELFNSMAFRLIEGAVFLMGSTRNDDEKPQDEVTVKAFYLGSHEVSRSQYQRFTEATERDFFETTPCTNDDCAMSYVSWEDATAYCAWLSSITGHTYRLPTEAEWEYAARGGTHDTDNRFWWGNSILKDHENWHGTTWDYDDGIAIVHSYEPNQFGLYNMLGNVSEWTRDCYDKYKGVQRDSSPIIIDPCNERVIRGGNYVDDPQKYAAGVSVTKRNNSKQTNRSDLWGFRVAREIETK